MLHFRITDYYWSLVQLYFMEFFFFFYNFRIRIISKIYPGLWIIQTPPPPPPTGPRLCMCQLLLHHIISVLFDLLLYGYCTLTVHVILIVIVHVFTHRTRTLKPLSLLDAYVYLLPYTELCGAYHLAKKSGNFGLKSNGKVIFRKFRSEIVEYLQRYSSFSFRNGTVQNSLPFE